MLRKKLREKKGTTLVELVVTFTLFTLFCVAVMTVLTLSAGTYESVSERGNSQMVGQLLLDKIAGEIAAAQPGADSKHGLTVADGSGDFAYGTCIAFCSREGSGVYITAHDGTVLIHYRPLTDGTHTLEAVDWQFDEAVYNGFTVPTDGLLFEILAGNVIHITLKLQSSTTDWLYTTERFIQCDNFADSVAMTKFGYGTVKKDT